MEENQVMSGIQPLQRFGNGKINSFYVLVPVFQFPGIPVRVSLDHPLMADFGISHDPDNNKFCSFVTELGAKTLQSFFVVDFFGERGVDQYNIIVFQRFNANVNNSFIFIVPDILFEELRTSVYRLVCGRKYPVGQRDQGIFVKIDNMFQIFCKLF